MAKKTTAAAFAFGRTRLYHEDCFAWLRRRKRNSIHGVVTDPPYGLVEYSPLELERRENGNGVWRLPPAFDAHVSQLTLCHEFG